MYAVALCLGDEEFARNSRSVFFVLDLPLSRTAFLFHCFSLSLNDSFFLHQTLPKEVVNELNRFIVGQVKNTFLSLKSHVCMYVR